MDTEKLTPKKRAALEKRAGALTDRLAAHDARRAPIASERDRILLDLVDAGLSFGHVAKSGKVNKSYVGKIVTRARASA